MGAIICMKFYSRKYHRYKYLLSSSWGYPDRCDTSFWRYSVPGCEITVPTFLALYQNSWARSPDDPPLCSRRAVGQRDRTLLQVRYSDQIPGLRSYWNARSAIYAMKPWREQRTSLDFAPTGPILVHNWPLARVLPLSDQALNLWEWEKVTYLHAGESALDGVSLYSCDPTNLWCLFESINHMKTIFSFTENVEYILLRARQKMTWRQLDFGTKV